MFELTNNGVRWLDAKEFLERNDDPGKDLFCDRWKGLDSNWNDLEDYVNWLTRARDFVVRKYITDKGIALASQRGLAVLEVQEWLSRIHSCLENFKIALNEFLTIAEYSEGELLADSESKIADLFRMMQPGGNYRHITSCDVSSDCVFFVESDGPFDLKIVEMPK